jgi:hypothetical protein
MSEVSVNSILEISMPLSPPSANPIRLAMWVRYNGDPAYQVQGIAAKPKDGSPSKVSYVCCPFTSSPFDLESST